jgi:hypothetical protein
VSEEHLDLLSFGTWTGRRALPPCARSTWTFTERAVATSHSGSLVRRFHPVWRNRNIPGRSWPSDSREQPPPHWKGIRPPHPETTYRDTDRVLGQRRADGVVGGRWPCGSCVDSDAISSAPLARPTVRLGELIGRHLRAARCGGRIKSSPARSVTQRRRRRGRASVGRPA